MSEVQPSPVRIVITPSEDSQFEDSTMQSEAPGLDAKSEPRSEIEAVMSPTDCDQEFLPAVDCVATEVCVDVGDSGHSSEDTFLVEEEGCCSYDRVLIEWGRLSKSVYLLPIYVLLFALPLVTVYVGGQNIFECPGCQFVPLFLFMMGFVGTLIAACHIGKILYNLVFPDVFSVPKGTYVIGFGAFTLCYVTELLYFFSASISFDFSEPTYCKEYFYNFAYYLNFLHLGAIVLVALINYPNLCVCRRQTETQT